MFFVSSLFKNTNKSKSANKKPTLPSDDFEIGFLYFLGSQLLKLKMWPLLHKLQLSSRTLVKNVPLDQIIETLVFMSSCLLVSMNYN